MPCLPICVIGDHANPGAGRSAPPPALRAPPPPPRTPQNVSLRPRAEAKRLLQINLFLKVNGQHILAKRNSAFWRAPGMYADNQRIISWPCLGGRGGAGAHLFGQSTPLLPPAPAGLGRADPLRSPHTSPQSPLWPGIEAGPHAPCHPTPPRTRDLGLATPPTPLPRLRLACGGPLCGRCSRELIPALAREPCGYQTEEWAATHPSFTLHPPLPQGSSRLG